MTISRVRRFHGNGSGAGTGSVGNCGSDRNTDNRAAGLIRVIERDIIPRLFLTHRADAGGYCGGPAQTVAPDEIADFAQFVLSHDAAQIMARIHSFSTLGVSLQRIYLDLIAPAARHLREFGDLHGYDADAVSRGLARLRQVLGEIGRSQADRDDTGAEPYPLM
jgi:MerR family transcriptional regulator, light-induced transcriptional regulator